MPKVSSSRVSRRRWLNEPRTSSPLSGGASSVVALASSRVHRVRSRHTTTASWFTRTMPRRWQVLRPWTGARTCVMSNEVHRRGGCHAIEHLFPLCKPVPWQRATCALFTLSVAGETSRTLKRRVLRLLSTVSFDVMHVQEPPDDP